MLTRVSGGCSRASATRARRRERAAYADDPGLERDFASASNARASRSRSEMPDRAMRVTYLAARALSATLDSAATGSMSTGVVVAIILV